MELIRITTLEQLQSIKREWVQILKDNNNSNPFIEFEWLSLWLKHIGRDADVEIAAVIKDGKYIAFFPFEKRKCFFVTVYSMIGFGQSNYMDFIVRPIHLVETVEFVFGKLMKDNQKNVFSLHGILESSPTHHIVSNYLEQHSYRHTIHKVVTPYINLEKIQMDKYMDKRKKLHRLDRREKRLHLLGKVEHRICSIDEMDLIFEIHDKRWERKNDTSGFTNENERLFYTELLLKTNKRYRPVIDALYVEGKMIAFNYGFLCGNRYLGYVLGYDNDFESFSPGRMLEKEAILKLVNTDLAIFDLSIGYEPYKFEWNTHIDYTSKFIFSSFGKRISVARYCLSFKEKLIEKLKMNRKIVLLKRDALGQLKYFAKKLFMNPNVKEKKEIWLRLTRKVKSYTFKKNSSLIMKKEVERTRKPGLGEGFKELQLKDAIFDKRFKKQDLKNVCTKLYGGYQAYYKAEASSCTELIWTNRKVLRLGNIPYIKELRKNAIWLEDWNRENLLDICKFVQKEHLIHSILLEVDQRDKLSINLLQEVGFKVDKKISGSTIFGKKRVWVNENQ